MFLWRFRRTVIYPARPAVRGHRFPPLQTRMNMKKTVGLLISAVLLSGVVAGCAYGGVATAGDKAVVMRNDAFLFGALRKAFVCKVTDAGLSSCAANEAP